MSYEILQFKPDSKVEKIKQSLEKDIRKKPTKFGDAVIDQYCNEKEKENLTLDLLKNPILKKQNRYSHLNLLINFNKGSKLNIRKNRLFKFNTSSNFKDDSIIFIDPIDRRSPDLSQIFLYRFSVSNLINNNKFAVKLNFYGLPGSQKDNRFHIIIPENTTNSSSDKNHLVYTPKKKSNEDYDPIPKPIFQTNKTLSYPSIYPTELLEEVTSCKETEQGKTCQIDSNNMDNQYNLFSIFNFCIEVEKENGSIFKDNDLISFQVEFKYYFLHYYPIKEKNINESR